MSIQKITEEEYNKIGAYNTQMSMFNLGQQKYVENKRKENRQKLIEELGKSLNLPDIDSKVKGAKLSFSIEARHKGFDDENKKSPPLPPNPAILKPFPSCIFFLTRSSAFTGTFLVSVGL